MTFTRLSDAARNHAALLFALSVAGLAIRVLLVPDPILMHDEYFYSKTTQLWAAHQQDLRQITPVADRGDAGFPNALFFAIYSVVYRFGDNFYVVAKLFNVFFATVSALAIARVGALVATPQAGLLIGALALWMPSTSYHSYFMPEALYECLVWWGLAAFMLTVRRDLRIASACLGLLLGAAILAKPNAAAMLAAANLAIVVVAWRCAPTARRVAHLVQALVALNLAFVAAGYGLHLALTGHLRWDPIGTFYQHSLSQVATIEADATFGSDFARYAFVYLYAALIAFGAPLVVLLSTGLPRSRDMLTTALWAFAVIGLGVLLLGSAKVGVNWERVFVNHIGIYSTRYMAVLFPLLVIGLVAFLPQAHERIGPRRLWGAVLGVALIALAVVYRSIDNPTQLPEIFGTSRLYGRLFKPTLAAGLAVMLYVAVARRPRLEVYAVFIAVYAVASAVGLVREDWRRAVDWQAKVYADAGRAMRLLVAPEHWDRGLIVSTSSGRASRVMTLFPGIVPVQIAPRGSTIARDALTGAPAWVLLIDDLRSGFDARCVGLAEARLCELVPGALR